jgi:poly(hydroxyalkanoate) depolymerase family esterase
MNSNFQRLMAQATQLTSSGDLLAATAAIQRALGHSHDVQPAPKSLVPDTATATVLDGYVVEQSPSNDPSTGPSTDPSIDHTTDPTTPTPQPVGKGAFISGSHTHAGLTLAYKLYQPAGAADRRLPLVVMLHGCTQDPDDFAAGTGMNALAQALGFLVLYPAQSQQANPSRCWNWFKHNHQGGSRGEAATIASMTQTVLAQHSGDSARVYIAGLSAGGAMAALVAAAHPELFAALGVHSGLAPGAAHNLPEALAAMRSGSTGLPGMATAVRPPLPVPTIVFHGDQDSTVHPHNGKQVTAAALAGAHSARLTVQDDPMLERGVSAGGQHYTRSVHGAAPAVVEHWLLHGAGHAWSGGQAEGSYTDPAGPDASREMLRFFFSQAPKTH